MYIYIYLGAGDLGDEISLLLPKREQLLRLLQQHQYVYVVCMCKLY